MRLPWARASLELIRVLRTLINSIAKNLHKLQICLLIQFTDSVKNSKFGLLNINPDAVFLFA